MNMGTASTRNERLSPTQKGMPSESGGKHSSHHPHEFITVLLCIFVFLAFGYVFETVMRSDAVQDPADSKRPIETPSPASAASKPVPPLVAR